MSSNLPINKAPYLRTSRDFPTHANELSEEIGKSYIDISNAVNDRTIGIYSTNRPVITGNSWFLNSSQKNQTLRQIYTFASASSVPHGIKPQDVNSFIHIYGTFTDGTNWYPLPHVDTTSITNQVSIQITSENIVITAGAGAPTITNGYVVLEWLTFSPSLV